MPSKPNETPVAGAEEPEERRQRVKAGYECFSYESRIQKDDVVEEYWCTLDITFFVILVIFIIAVFAWFAWYT